MFELWEFLGEIDKRVKRLITEITVEDFDSIEDAVKKASLETGKWYRVRNVAAVFSDLANSTGISNEKTKIGYSKILEYINFPFVKIHKKFGVDFLDVKGDGGLALYSGKEAELRAFLAAVTYKTFIEKYANKFFNQYDLVLRIGMGIDMGDLLVKRIGQKKDWNFYTWSGRVINNAALISKEIKQVEKNHSAIGVSRRVYEKINRQCIRKWTVVSCGCHKGRKEVLWRKYYVTGVKNFPYYLLRSSWCDKHGEEYLNGILKTLNLEREINSY